MFHNLDAVTIKNNLLVAGNGPHAFGTMTNCNIQNNIFHGLDLTPMGTFTDNDQVNNLTTTLSSNPFFTTANGNTSSGNLEDVEDPMFTNFSVTPAHNFSYNLTLLPGSPAIGSGFGGIDMGVFGGPNPFDVHGTSLPLIQNVIAPMTSPQGTNMNVRIQAKGN